MACGAKHHINAQSLSQSQKAMAAQSCLPILEAEAKARKVLAGRLFGENHPQEVVPVLAQPLESPENPTMLPKNNIKSAKAAGRIMGVGKTLVVAAKAIAKASPEMAEAIKKYYVTLQ